MSNALTTLTGQLATRLELGDDSGSLIETLKATAFKGQVSDAQMTALLVVANQYGLNPWTKEIYAFPDKQNGIVPVVGVDGWARIINDNQQFDGMEFRQSEKMVRMDGARNDAPEWMECVMFRKDRSKPIVIREYLDEVYRAPFKKDNGYVVEGPWQTHTKRFLRHKTMIQCARLAFGYTGIYDEDEAERIRERDMGNIDRSTGEVRPAGKPELPPCPQEWLDSKLPKLGQKVSAGTSTLQGVFDWIGGMYALSPAQVNQVNELEKLKPIEGEYTTAQGAEQ